MADFSIRGIGRARANALIKRGIQDDAAFLNADLATIAKLDNPGLHEGVEGATGLGNNNGGKVSRMDADAVLCELALIQHARKPRGTIGELNKPITQFEEKETPPALLRGRARDFSHLSRSFRNGKFSSRAKSGPRTSSTAQDACACVDAGHSRNRTRSRKRAKRTKRCNRDRASSTNVNLPTHHNGAPSVFRQNGHLGQVVPERPR